jgi:protein FrlC
MDMVREVDGELALNEARAHAIRDLCAQHGLELVCYTPEQLLYPSNYLAQDVPPFDGARLQQRSRRLVELCIDAAAALGCHRMVLVTMMWQWRHDATGYHRVTKSEIVDTAIEEIARFVRYAEERNVTILFEQLVDHDTNGIVTLEDAESLFARVDSPNLQLMLDTGHVHVTARRHGLDPVVYFREHLRRFAGRVTHIHVDDNTGEVDVHLAPGAGNIDLAGMVEVLRESGYQGWLSAELGILGEYALPENAERLLHETHRAMTALLDDATARLTP